MLLQEPDQSPYDLRFKILQFPVRIAWSFWLMGVIFGFNFVTALDENWLPMLGLNSPGFAPLLALWLICLLVSILIHELGHAVAFRQNGIESSIVLYHFGGLAIPRAGSSIGRDWRGLSPANNIWISLAGPLAQILSAVVVIAALKVAGYRLTVLAMMPGPFIHLPGALSGTEIANAGLFALVAFYVFPSVLWALLNLVPVWPLDGGHIARGLVTMFGGRLEQSLWISVIAAGLVAAYGFSSGQTYLTLLFLVLAVSNYQALQHSGQWR